MHKDGEFLDALTARVLVCDGAMGTLLHDRGASATKGFDALNLTDPDLVAGIHTDYVHAGADIIETNTFGATRFKLAAFGLADQAAAINIAGVRLARSAAGARAYVAGAFGPLGLRIEPWGKTGVDEARDVFREQAMALLEGGVDLFILETFRDLNEIGAAIDAVRSVSSLPIIAQMTTEEDGRTLDGTLPDRFVPELERRGATVLGVNCAVGPAAMLETIERIAEVTRLPLSAQPNAGKPRDVEGRNIYQCSPAYMASYVRRFAEHGVRVVGGCCGTTPEHTRQMRAAVDALASAGRTVAVAQTSASPGSNGVIAPPRGAAGLVPRAQKSHLAGRMANGAFVVIVELLPPRGFDAGAAVEAARAFKARGADAVAIPDGLQAGARLSALSLAVLVERQAGIEALLHYSCRDRTLLGIQSDLLGAHALGLRNVLLRTGEPSLAGDFPDATAVFDVDSIGMTNLVARLNQGYDVGGEPIGAPGAFHIGVSVNPWATSPDEELRRFDYKVEAGAEFVVTPPVFDLAAFEAFLKRIAHARLPVVAGVAPFESVRHAELMANEVPGVHVPEATIERMRRAEARGTARAEGLAIARELVAALRGRVQGVRVTSMDFLDTPLV